MDGERIGKWLLSDRGLVFVLFIVLVVVWLTFGGRIGDLEDELQYQAEMMEELEGDLESCENPGGSESLPGWDSDESLPAWEDL